MKHFVTSLLFITCMSPSQSEALNVKYIGYVDESQYNCQSTPESSFIEFICVAKSGRKQPNVIAKLNSTVYGWCDVPSYISEGWLSAYSKGRYFNAHIRGRWGC